MHTIIKIIEMLKQFKIIILAPKHVGASIIILIF